LHGPNANVFAVSIAQGSIVARAEVLAHFIADEGHCKHRPAKQDGHEKETEGHHLDCAGWQQGVKNHEKVCRVLYDNLTWVFTKWVRMRRLASQTVFDALLQVDDIADDGLDLFDGELAVSILCWKRPTNSGRKILRLQGDVR
jgi:hypothetical protein